MRVLRFSDVNQAEGMFVRQNSSRDVYGHVVLSVEPADTAELLFSWDVSVHDVPRNYLSAVRDGVTAWLEREQLLCLGTLIRVVGGSYNATDSSPMCYSQAAVIAFRNAIEEAGVVADA